MVARQEHRLKPGGRRPIEPGPFFRLEHATACVLRLWNFKDTRLVLYRLPDVVKAGTVLIVEEEKDVETAERFGLPEGWAATCNPMGAQKWKPEYSGFLRGKRVVILSDDDDAGRQARLRSRYRSTRGREKMAERSNR